MSNFDGSMEKKKIFSLYYNILTNPKIFSQPKFRRWRRMARPPIANEKSAKPTEFFFQALRDYVHSTSCKNKVLKKLVPTNIIEEEVESDEEFNKELDAPYWR